MMLAAIDVGSNTARMLLGHIEQGRLVPSRYERAITRLGGHFTHEKGLAPESMERTLDALKKFSEILQGSPAKTIRAVGTAALRRAENRDEFILRVAAETGLHLEVIDGQQEARLSASGVLHALDPQPEVSLVIDIGGGSTELILLQAQHILFRESYPLGVVRLCEESPDNAARLRIIAEVIAQFKTALLQAGLLELIQSRSCEFIGTAGTATTLAALDQQMEDYDWRRINNHVLPLEILEKQYTFLGQLTVAQREELPGLEVGRGDLIMPGILILRALIKHFLRPHLRVSDFGLLEGVLLDLSATSSN